MDRALPPRSDIYIFFHVYIFDRWDRDPVTKPRQRIIPQKPAVIRMRLRVYFVPFKVVASDREPAYRGRRIIPFVLNPFEACRI
jgi:hypothetical protein